jgi:hypothetical protein
MKAVTWMGASLVALGACSDGGGGDGPPTTLAGYDAEFAKLAEDAVGLAPTDLATLPITGSADYEGVIRLDTGDVQAAPERMSGTLDLALDFGSGAITGEATDFVTTSGSDEVPMQGSLAVTGDVTRDPSAEDDVLADIEGLIRVDTDPDLEDEGDYYVDGTLGGDFLGEDGEVIAGDVSGRLGVAGTPYSGEIGGDFIVER